MNRLCLILICIILLGAPLFASSYLSPVDIVYDGSQFLYIADHTSNQIQQFDTNTNTVSNVYAIDKAPNSLVMSSTDSDVLYITAGSVDGVLLKLNISSGLVESEIQVGHTPMSPVLNGHWVYVANRFDNSVDVVDLTSSSVVEQIPVVREPVDMAITPDGQTLVAANHLPHGSANINDISSEVSLIDLNTNTVSLNIPLSNGATGVKGVCVSPDGLYAYVTHLVGRYQMPTTQLDRGWVMTNALAIIDIQQMQLLTTVLLDDIYLGAANPWAVECTDDGQYLCVTHAGSHELSVIDRAALHARLDALVGGTPVPGGFSDTIDDVPHDLGFLSGLRERILFGGNGPRSLAVVGSMCYVPGYFSGTLSIAEIASSSDIVSVALGTQPAITQQRLGEQFYHDASQTYQKWLSCSSCHPDGRSDGLNWDLGNDGLGTPRQAKSHLLSHRLPPTTITGVRDSAETSVRAGYKFIEFAVRSEEDAVAIDEYLKSLKPVASPAMVDNTLSGAAWRGKFLFHSAGCADCHSDNNYADMTMYDVGTGYGSGEAMDTPTLVEVWQTAPYLHDGRAMTIKEVLTTYNPNDQHGVTSNLTASEIDDLAEYVKSISAVTHPGDIDDNGITNTIDLSLLVQNWLWMDCGLCDFADLDDNQRVDLLDYSVFSEYWMQ